MGRSRRPSRAPSREATSPRAARAVADFEHVAGTTATDAARRAVALLAEHAPSLVPLVLADPRIPDDALARPLDRPDDRAGVRAAVSEATTGIEDGPVLAAALRRARHRALVRIALREIEPAAGVEQTSAELSELAAAITEAALAAAARALAAQHGVPRTESGADVPFVTLGMGKLGGAELNLGSDIDLCFFYGTDEARLEASPLAPHEYFAKLAARITRLLSDVTEDGFCFRVDLRLRPEGSRGPLVNSLASAERYYETWGRTWERAALLRARPIAGDLAFGEALLAELTPFVFRRAVDPRIGSEMASLLTRSRRELGVDEGRDVKLGRGGIREAEFFVQSLQLIWGGQHPEVRVPGTLAALERLRAAGLVADREAARLANDWALLRRVEHRVHMWTGYQTHRVPPAGTEREWFARSLGFDGTGPFEQALEAAREDVHRLFVALAEPSDAAQTEFEVLADRVAAGAGRDEIDTLLRERLGVRDVDEAHAHLLRLGRFATSPLGPVGRERTPALGPLLLAEVASTADPDQALRLLADLFARLLGPWPYAELLEREPRTARRLVSLFGTSSTLSTALVSHPETLDQFLVDRDAPTAESIRAAHAAALTDAGPADEEAATSALRRVRREVTLQVGLLAAAGELDLETTEALLSELATCQVASALALAERWAGAAPLAPLVVIGLGKLGAGEMGFGSDLDLMFLFRPTGDAGGDDEGGADAAAEHATRVAQRTMRVLSQPDVEGPGYSADTRLRPSGSHGLLVVSLAAFDRYHARDAAPWERQALVRARPIAGDPALSCEVEARLVELAYDRPPPTAEEVARMRHRIEAELGGETSTRYHPKLGHGALLDVEFAVQWLQMRHGQALGVRDRRTLGALRALVAAGAVEPTDAETLADGHRYFRTVEQALRLMDETREPALDARTATPLARWLRLRARDGLPPEEVLRTTWRRHAGAVREVFEHLVGPVGLRAPWGRT